MSYKIGISSGWWSIAKSEELLGLARKIGSTATYGVNFVQVDFESIAEFQEPDVVRNIKRMLDTLQIDWGMHGEIGENMALECALEVVWNHSHRRLHLYLDSIYYKFIVEEDLREYIPKFLVFHASNMPTIAMIVERFRYAGMLTVDIYGNTNWIEFITKDEKLKKWVEDSELLYLLIARESGLAFESVEKVKEGVIAKAIEKEISTEERQSEIKRLTEELVREGIPLKDAREEATARVGEKIKKEKEIEKNIHEYAWNFFREVTKIRFVEGAITYEEMAYLIVARYLFERRDDPREPLWRMFFPDYSDADGWDRLEKNFFKINFFDKEKGEVRLPPEIVALVAARYIIGHFSEKNKEEFIAEEKRVYTKGGKDFENFLVKTPFEKIIEINEKISEKKGKGIHFRIVFENPEITRVGEEGLQRLIHVTDIYRMVKAAHQLSNFPCLGIVFDQEHYLHNNIDPLKEIEDLKKLTEKTKEDVGEYLIVFHVGAPKPYHPAHEPIDIGSEAQYWIYRYAFELRKLGFGKKKEGIFIFERGGARGGQVPAQFIGQSAAALRIIVEHLEKEVDPEKLPPEFYGLSSREILSEERQLAIIKEHFFDPLKGMLQVPEEEYTFLGAKAIEKGKKPEEWKKEELR
jgi:hypothetical protein